MMNGQTNQSGEERGFEARLRTMRILWGSYLASIFAYVLITVLILRPDAAAEEGADNPTMLAALAAVGLTSVAVSFLIKGRFYAQATEQGNPAKFQTGFVIAALLCDIAGLLGFVAFFVTRNRDAYLLFAIGAAGLLLHFPRREQLAAAYQKGF